MGSVLPKYISTFVPLYVCGIQGARAAPASGMQHGTCIGMLSLFIVWQPGLQLPNFLTTPDVQEGPSACRVENDEFLASPDYQSTLFQS